MCRAEVEDMEARGTPARLRFCGPPEELRWRISVEHRGSGRGGGDGDRLDDAVVVLGAEREARGGGARGGERQVVPEVAVRHPDEEGRGLGLWILWSVEEVEEPVEHEARLRSDPRGGRLRVTIADVADLEHRGGKPECFAALRAVGVALADLGEVAIGGVEVLPLDGGARLLEQPGRRIEQAPEARAARQRGEQQREACAAPAAVHRLAPDCFSLGNAASIAWPSSVRAPGVKRAWKRTPPSRLTSSRNGSEAFAGSSDVV